MKAQRNRLGRTFFYYEKFRGTPKAWPRLNLVFHPGEGSFYERHRQCELLQAERGEAGWRWSFAGTKGEVVPLPDPQADAVAFWNAVEEADAADRRAKAKSDKTFSSLIGAFKEHKQYEKLAPGSIRDYKRHLDSIADLWGDLEVRHLRPRDAQDAIDTYADRPNAGRYFRAVLSRLIEFGIPREFCDTNVVASTHKPDHEQEPFPPWPDWAFEVFLDHARPGLHMAMHSAIYTGQRSVDVVPMLRPSKTARAIELVSRKTGAEVFVPIHPEYRALIDAEGSEHAALHLREDGEAWTLAGFRTAWQRDFTFKAEPDDGPEAREKEAAMHRLREANIVFHGLRKNCVCVLLEVGCTEAEVASLVQMSEQMVRHYSRGVNRRRLAEAAMKKLETNWGTARGALFGRARTEGPK